MVAVQEPAPKAKVYPLFNPPESELSMKHPLLVDGVQAAPEGPPRFASVVVNPILE